MSTSSQFALLLLLTGFINVSASRAPVEIAKSNFKPIRAEFDSLPRKWASAAESIDAHKVQPVTRKNANWRKVVTNTKTSINFYLLPLYSNIFYFSVLIGSNGFNQNLIFDFVSGLTFLQASDCNPCFNDHTERFPISSSATSQTLKCKVTTCPSKTCTKSNTCAFNSTYVGGSFNGVAATDSFGFYSTTTDASTLVSVKNFVFGYVRSSSNFTVAGIDGLGGFGSGNYSFPNQFAQVTGRNAFSVCFARFTSSYASKLIIGKDAIAPTKLSYTPLLKNPNYNGFHLQIESIYVGNTKANVTASAFAFDAKRPLRGTILDSTFSGLGLANAAFTPVLTLLRNNPQLKSLVKTKPTSGFSLCFFMSSSNASKLEYFFPTITINFSNKAQLKLKGYQYASTVAVGVVCVNMSPTGEASRLSSQNLQNVLTVFDMEGKRIGFKTMACSPSG